MNKSQSGLVIVTIGVTLFLVFGWFRKNDRIEKLETANQFYVNRINEQRKQIALHRLDRERLARKITILYDVNKSLVTKDSVSRVELRMIRHKFDELNSNQLSQEMIHRFDKDQKQ